MLEYVHFGLTSEDVTNVAYASMFVDCWDHVLVPLVAEIELALAHMASAFKSSSMMSMTHGQPASPTTFGKEMANFLSRLRRQRMIVFSGGDDGNEFNSP